ncbi:MAG: hypothetical protein WBZ01_01765 [Terriglobales bacterium]|jgi:hypothetical protein
MYLVIDVPGVGPVFYQVPDIHPHKLATSEAQPRLESRGYPELIVDASIVASLQETAKSVSDSGVRQALSGGIHAAVQALQKRAGNEVTIKEDMPRAA